MMVHSVSPAIVFVLSAMLLPVEARVILNN